MHGDQRCVRDNGHRTEHIEGIVPTADIRSDASERPLIDITVFESIGTKFKDVIHQCTDRHPRKDLVSSSIESSFPSSCTYRREQSHVSILFEDRQIISIGPVERGQRLRLFHGFTDFARRILLHSFEEIRADLFGEFQENGVDDDQRR